MFTAKCNWTLEIIGAYINREFGQEYSIPGISKMSLSKPRFQA
ncbi:winged helix-turn-helix domain-containing protein [Paenibacillus profundus]